MTQPLLRAENVTKQFSNVVALNQVTFEINDGEAVALVGPNGAGKSTLMSIICGFLKASKGQIDIGGHAPGSRETFSIVAALPQDALLNPNESVGEQLAFLARLQGFSKTDAISEAHRVLEVVKLPGQFTSKPKTLSHGMSKRISIAQAMIGSPRLIVLDEPTAGLDPETARHIRQTLSELIGNTTLLISSHNLDELEDLCQRTLFLEKGTMREVGHDEAAESNYLTIEMDSSNMTLIQATVAELNGVLSAIERGRQGLLIQYDPNKSVDLDLELLILFKQKGWVYRSIQKGRTLEDQLFTNHPSETNPL